MTEIPLWAWAVAALAGGLAALVRTALVRAFARHELPVGVLVANTLASAIGGLVLGNRGHLGAVALVILVGGVCGGLSTLSTLAADTVELWMEGRRRLGLAH